MSFQYEHETEWVMPEEFPDLTGVPEIAIDLETYDPHLKEVGSGWATKQGHIIGVAVAIPGMAWYFPIRHENGANFDARATLRWVKDVCNQPDTTYVFHNAMYDVGWLRCEGIEVAGKIVDTMIAAPLIDENRFSYSLNALGRDYLKETKSERTLTEAAKSMGLNPKSEMYKLPAHFVGAYAEQDAALTLRLWHHLRGIIHEDQLTSIFDLETQVFRVILDMRTKGVRVDMEKAESVKKFLMKEEEQILSSIKKEYGAEVNLWAAKSVALAFDAAGLEYPRTATDQPSFTKNFLANHAHDLPKKIVRARELNKARTTFIDSITRHSHNGRIHADIHQLRGDEGGTITGRFCVHADTVLELDIGPVKIGEYNPTGKEKILTHTGEWHRVVRRIYKGEEEMYCLRVDSGDTLKCTGNHRVLTARGWVSVKNLSKEDNLIHVGVEEVLERRTGLPSCGELLSIRSKAYGNRDSRAVEHDSTQRNGGVAETSSPRAIEGGAISSVFKIEDRRQEPNAREDGKESSQLQRGSFVRSSRIRVGVTTRVVHGENIEARLQALGCNVRAVGDTGCTGGYARPSHRWGQDQQRPFKLSFGDSGRAPAFTRTVSVTEIEPMGIAPVWDIEVETDHSYVAHGLVHHNSYSNPNLQQLPSRDDFISPLIRGLFLPEEGDVWGSFDYSSQEPRIVVHYAHLVHVSTRDRGGRYAMQGADVFAEQYRENPRMDFYKAAADMMGIARSQAKTCTLGIMYGMGVNKLSEQLGLDLASGKEFFQEFNASVPFVKELSNYVTERAEKNGHIRTLLGRKGRFDKWEPRSFGVHKPMVFEDALREYGHPLKRAFTYKALNKLIQGSAADQTKKAMVELHAAGIPPMVQIHDELAVSVSSAEQARQVVEIMENCVQMEIPSVVDAELGPSWGEAKLSIKDAFGED